MTLQRRNKHHYGTAKESNHGMIAANVIFK